MKRNMVIVLCMVMAPAAAWADSRATYAVQFEIEDQAPKPEKATPQLLLAENQSARLEVVQKDRSYFVKVHIDSREGKPVLMVEFERQANGQKMKLDTVAEMKLGEKQVIANFVGPEHPAVKLSARLDRQ